MPEGSVGFGVTLSGVPRIRTRPQAAPRRRLLGAAGLSLLLHSLVLVALLLGLAHRARLADATDTPAVVELVMSPPGGRVDAPAVAPPPSPAPPSAQAEPAQTQPAPTAQAEKTEAQAPSAAVPLIPEPLPPPPVSVAELAAETSTPIPVQPAPDSLPPPASVPEPAPAQPPPVAPAPAAEPTTAATAQPTPEPVAPPQPPAPRAQQAPQFSFGSLASDTNALVTGDLLVPPSVDPKFRNRKPSYPREAAQRGEHGAVLLQIHVSPDGLVSSAGIARSSGYRLLDDAAREAVLSWHFLPAVKDGQPVPFDMPLRIVFDLF